MLDQTSAGAVRLDAPRSGPGSPARQGSAPSPELPRSAEPRADDDRALLASETDILDGLLAAASLRDSEETVAIEIARQGRVVLRFTIHGISQRVYDQCFEDAGRFVSSRQLGGQRVRESTDRAMLYSLLILEATAPEDRERLWENEPAQRRVLAGTWDMNRRRRAAAMIEACLRPGEKEAVVERIEKLSGYGMDLIGLGKD